MKKRKHIRLYDFDYLSANAYFITICIKDLTHVFGEIINGFMYLSAIGKTATLYLQRIPELRKNILLDEAIVMPNHVHCILEIIKDTNAETKTGQYGKPVAGSVSVMMNQYKGAVTKWCIENGYPEFEWQSRFYDHVIRDNESYEKIKNYIATNPVNWSSDKFFRRDLPLANPE